MLKSLVDDNRLYLDSEPVLNRQLYAFASCPARANRGRSIFSFLTNMNRTPQIHRTQFQRKDLKPGENLCEHCTAKCCRYFALPIDAPQSFSDFEYIRWFLLHEQASVFTEDESWYLLVHTVCKHLQHDHRCGIYETRPQICRDYSNENCEYDDGYTYEKYFETPEQIEEFTNARFNSPENFRSPRPGLTVLN